MEIEENKFYLSEVEALPLLKNFCMTFLFHYRVHCDLEFAIKKIGQSPESILPKLGFPSSSAINSQALGR